MRNPECNALQKFHEAPFLYKSGSCIFRFCTCALSGQFYDDDDDKYVHNQQSLLLWNTYSQRLQEFIRRFITPRAISPRVIIVESGSKTVKSQNAMRAGRVFFLRVLQGGAREDQKTSFKFLVVRKSVLFSYELSRWL